MRDSFVFYRSWAKSIEMLPKNQQLEIFKAITNYALDDIETEDLSGSQKIIYEMAKPTLTANNKRYKNGCTGGRPKDDDSPRKELPGIELTNLTEKQYEKLVDKYGEEITNKAIEEFEKWLSIGNKNAQQYIGKNHYGHFKFDHWPITNAKKALGLDTKPNWSI